MGRKPSKTPMKMWPVIGFKLHPDVKKFYETQASKEGRTLAQEIRKLLDDNANSKH